MSHIKHFSFLENNSKNKYGDGMIAELRDISRDISKIVSVLLHTGEVFWSSHSFLYSVSIFDMFV